MNNECRMCLLREAGEIASYKTVEEYLSTIDASQKVDDNVYNNRLSYCKKCNNLISGMCLKCGCYVEVRAAIKESHCPNADKIKW